MKKLFAIILLGGLLSSCEKVIDVDLNDSDPKYVIESTMELGNHEFKVHISQTSSYFDADTVIGIEGATVSIMEENGNQQVLFDDGNGSYRIPFFSSNTGEEYTLMVTIANQSFEAKATMPRLIEADTVFLGERDRPEITFSDPIEEENYYRIQLFKNGEQINANRRFKEIMIDHTVINGNTMSQRLGAGGGFGNDGDDFVSGDELVVKLQSIDIDGYRFFSTLQDVSGGNGPGATAPGNPINNWSNGALGYFTAVASDAHSRIVP